MYYSTNQGLNAIFNRKRFQKETATNAARNFNCLYDYDRTQSEVIKEMKQTFKLGDRFIKKQGLANNGLQGDPSAKRIVMNQGSTLKDFDQSMQSYNFEQISPKQSMKGALYSQSEHYQRNNIIIKNNTVNTNEADMTYEDGQSLATKQNT